MPLIVKARQRSGTSSLDLTIPVSFVKQYGIRPGDIFSVKCERKRSDTTELTYTKIIINLTDKD